MQVIAFDAYLAEERFRELGVERASTPGRDLRRRRLHHRPPAEEQGDRRLVERGRVREDEGRRADPQRRARPAGRGRGPAGGAGLGQGRRRRARRLPHRARHRPPLFGYPNVVVTPHLGASTTEATDRAGYQAAEQVVAALTGGAVTSAVNVPAIAADDLEAVGPFLGLCASLGRIVGALAPGTSVDSVDVEFLGRIAEHDSRLLTIQVVKGLLTGHTEEPVNDVNAFTLAARAGHRDRRAQLAAGAGLHRPRPGAAAQRRRDDAGRRHRARPPQPTAPARGVGLALQRPARGAPRRVPLPRPARNARPGRDGARRRRASTSSRPRSVAARPAPATARPSWSSRRTRPVPDAVLAGLLAGDDFFSASAVSL